MAYIVVMLYIYFCSNSVAWISHIDSARIINLHPTIKNIHTRRAFWRDDDAGRYCIEKPIIERHVVKQKVRSKLRGYLQQIRHETRPSKHTANQLPTALTGHYSPFYIKFRTKIIQRDKTRTKLFYKTWHKIISHGGWAKRRRFVRFPRIKTPIHLNRLTKTVSYALRTLRLIATSQQVFHSPRQLHPHYPAPAQTTLNHHPDLMQVQQRRKNDPCQCHLVNIPSVPKMPIAMTWIFLSITLHIAPPHDKTPWAADIRRRHTHSLKRQPNTTTYALFIITFTGWFAEHTHARALLLR